MNKPTFSTIKGIAWPKRIVWGGEPPLITAENFDLLMRFADACGAEVEVDHPDVAALQEENNRLRIENADLDQRATEYANLNDRQARRIAGLEAALKATHADHKVVAWASYHGTHQASITGFPWIAQKWEESGGDVRRLCIHPEDRK